MSTGSCSPNRLSRRQPHITPSPPNKMRLLHVYLNQQAIKKISSHPNILPSTPLQAARLLPAYEKFTLAHVPFKVPVKCLAYDSIKKLESAGTDITRSSSPRRITKSKKLESRDLTPRRDLKTITPLAQDLPSLRSQTKFGGWSRKGSGFISESPGSTRKRWGSIGNTEQFLLKLYYGVNKDYISKMEGRMKKLELRTCRTTQNSCAHPKLSINRNASEEEHLVKS